MYHLLAWSEDVVTATQTDLNPVVDPIIPIVNNHFMPSEDMSAYWALAFGTNLQMLQVSTPKLVQVAPPYIRPIQGSLIGVSDQNECWMDRVPMRFRGQEEIVLYATQNAGANQQITALMALGTRLVAVPPGDIYRVRATSTTAAVANTWTQITYTLGNQLPAGRYAVVLVEWIAANAQAVRATFDDQYYRPGGPGMPTALSRVPYQWTDYSLGVWGYFYTYSLPRLEVLANGTPNSHELYFHVIKMAA